MILVCVFGMQRNLLKIIIITHSLGPFSGIVTAGQLTGQLSLIKVCLHHNIIKGPSLN